MSGCVSKRGLSPEDTKLKDSDRDWYQVYHHELKIAIENEDSESRYFFLQEIIKMNYKKEYGLELPPNPSIRILNQ